MEISRERAERVADLLDADLRDSYSGRSMYGRECVGWVGDFTEADLVFALIDVFDDVGEARGFTEEAYFCSDSMGMSTIVYLSNVQVAS